MTTDSSKICRRKAVAFLLLLTTIVSASVPNDSVITTLHNSRRQRTSSSSFVTHPHQQKSFLSSNNLQQRITQQKQQQQTQIPLYHFPRGGNQLNYSIVATTFSGTVYFIALDIAIRKLFQKYDIIFPSMMGGCMVMFVMTLLIEVIHPGWGDAIFDLLSPGAGWLAKWMPVFFVPGLVMLPLAPKIESSLEVAKVISIIVLGFFFTLFTTAYSVLGLRKLQGKIGITGDDEDATASAAQNVVQKGKRAVLTAVTNAVKDGKDSVLQTSKKSTDNTLTAAADALKKGKESAFFAVTKAEKEKDAAIALVADALKKGKESVLSAVTNADREELDATTAGAIDALKKRKEAVLSAVTKIEKEKDATIASVTDALRKGSESAISTVTKVVKEGADATISAATDAAKKGTESVISVATEAAIEAQETFTAVPSQGKKTSGVATTSKDSSPVSKPYSAEIVRILAVGAVISGACSIYATRIYHPLAIPLQTLFLLFITVGTFVFGARLPPLITKTIHPLIISTIGVILSCQLLASTTFQYFEDVLAAYKSGTISPMKAGAGDLIHYMLGPAVCALSMPMYSRKKLMSENFLAVLISTLVSAVGGLFGTAAFVRLINLSGKVLRLSVLSRNVTTILAMAITDILGGNSIIAGNVVVLTGILGGTYGPRILTAIGIHDPISRGLGIGAAAQGLGTAGILNEKEAFPFAAINMVLTGACASALVSFSAVREVLISIALGAEKVVE